MRPRTLLAPFGLAAVLASSLAPAVSASAHPSHATKPGFASTAPTFVDINGKPRFDKYFDVSEGSNDIHLRGGTQPGGIVSVMNPATGKTICEAPNTAPVGEAADFHCIATAPFPFGESSLTATVRSSDGHLVSETSAPAGIAHQYTRSVMKVDSYDDATKTLRVSGTSLAGERFTVTDDSSFVARATGAVRPDGSWSAVVEGYERETQLLLRLPDSRWARPTGVILHAAGYAPTPVVCGCTVIESVAKVTIQGEPGRVIIYDEDDKKVAGGVIPHGDYKVTIGVPVPSGERHYTAELVQGDAVSKRVPFTLLEGEASAPVEEPLVVRAVVQSGKVITAVSASAGGVVRVTDDAGRVVAVGTAGASGSKQLAFALPGGRASMPTYSVTQAVHGATSAPAHFMPVAG